MKRSRQQARLDAARMLLEENKKAIVVARPPPPAPERRQEPEELDGEALAALANILYHAYCTQRLGQSSPQFMDFGVFARFIARHYVLRYMPVGDAADILTRRLAMAFANAPLVMAALFTSRPSTNQFKYSTSPRTWRHFLGVIGSNGTTRYGGLEFVYPEGPAMFAAYVIAEHARITRPSNPHSILKWKGGCSLLAEPAPPFNPLGIEGGGKGVRGGGGDNDDRVSVVSLVPSMTSQRSGESAFTECNDQGSGSVRESRLKDRQWVDKYFTPLVLPDLATLAGLTPAEHGHLMHSRNSHKELIFHVIYEHVRLARLRDVVAREPDVDRRLDKYEQLGQMYHRVAWMAEQFIVKHANPAWYAGRKADPECPFPWGMTAAESHAYQLKVNEVAQDNATLDNSRKTVKETQDMRSGIIFKLLIYEAYGWYHAGVHSLKSGDYITAIFEYTKAFRGFKRHFHRSSTTRYLYMEFLLEYVHVCIHAVRASMQARAALDTLVLMMADYSPPEVQREYEPLIVALDARIKENLALARGYKERTMDSIRAFHPSRMAAGRKKRH